MNEITHYQARPDGTPRVMDQRAYQTIAAIKNHTDRDWRGNTTLPVSAMPSDAVRAKMTLRLNELELSLRPAGVEGAMPEVVSVLATMMTRSGDETDAKVFQRIYAGDVADVPLFALRLACADYRQKKVGDGKWAPTQGDLRQRALWHARPFIDERADLIAILQAKPSLEAPRPATDEERAAMLARVEASRKSVADALVIDTDAPENRTSDRWDAIAEGRRQAERDRHQPVSVTRAQADEKLAGMTYAANPVGLSEAAAATISRSVQR